MQAPVLRQDGSTFAYGVLLVVSTVDAAAYSLIAPVGPAIAAKTGAPPAAMGLLVATFPFGVMIGFVLSAFAVHHGRTKIALVTSLAVVVVGSLGFVTGHSLSAYFDSRFVMGFGSGGVWIGVTFNVLARCPGQESKCMSQVFAAYSVGGLIGPLIGATGAVVAPFGIYAAVVFVCIGLVLLTGPGGASTTFSADWQSMRAPLFWLAALGNLFAYVALGMIEGVLPLHLSSSLSQARIGLLYACVSIVVAAVAAAGARFAPRRTLLSGVLLVVLGITVTGAGEDVFVWGAGLVVGGIGFGLAITGSITLLLEGVTASRIVAAMVVWSQIGIVGYLVGPLAGGVSAASLGYGSLGLVAGFAGLPVVLLFIRDSRSSWRRDLDST